MIENNSISEEEMEKIAKPSPAASIPKEREDVANYGRALEFVDFLSDAEFTIDESIIRQIHWLLMKGIHDTRIKPGEYRNEPNWIEDQGVRVYEPPFYVDVPILMREFTIWLRENESLDPIIKAAIAHAHLIAIHPFVDGNGRTARLLATLVLQKQGYGFRKLLSLDVYYQGYRDRYIKALSQSLGPKFSPDYDLTPWLQFFTLSIILQASRLETKLTDWRMWVEKAHKGMADSGLSDRQIDGLIYAMNVGYITRKDYMEIVNVSPLTATRDLAFIVKKGLLIPQGVARNKRYLFGSGKQRTIQKEEIQPKMILPT
jgi:Fic family protein